MVKTVIFRVDSSIEMGAGHVMRCLTLAEELSQRGYECTFISRQQPGSLIKLVKQRGYSVYELPECEESRDDHLAHSRWLKGGQEKDFQESLVVIEKTEADWLVIDHYGVDKVWEQKARDYVKNILVIDDLADREHDCDILLDQNLGQTSEVYQALLPKSCIVLAGSHYTLLRSEFLDYRERSLEYRRKKKQIDRLLITMGGVDKDNYTEKALTALELSHVPDNSEVLVVLGNGAPWLTNIKKQAKASRLKVGVANNIQNMAERMANTDLAIGAAGSTSWERSCLGVPSIMCVIADNQRVVANALSSEGAAILATGADVTQSIQQQVDQLLQNAYRLTELSKAAAKVVDGKGTNRVAQAMQNRF